MKLLGGGKIDWVGKEWAGLFFPRGKNGPAYFFPGERMGRPILSPGKKLTGGKFRPVTPGLYYFHESKTCSLLQELKKRESIIAKKEAMLAEKSELEIKRLRSSQVVNKVGLIGIF